MGFTRGVHTADIPTTDVRIGDKLCCWLSDGSAYPTVTGWSDKTLTRVPGKPVQRTFTVSGDVPWWVRSDPFQTISDRDGTTFIVARDQEVTQ
jgi:hypothetical protein